MSLWAFSYRSDNYSSIFCLIGAYEFLGIEEIKEA
jgi:hypothetical protein